MTDTTISRREFLSSTLLAGAAASSFACATTANGHAAHPPNVVVILADDMGWGDPQCYNADSAIPTPNIDRLAAEGMRFTDAHSPGAVCTPSRYGLLTGRYYWRLGLDRAGMNGYSANIVDPRRMTIASMLRDRGYQTACVGKWHLGMGTAEPADYFEPLHPNPTTFGFDSYFGIPASLDYAPYVFVENDRVLQPPTNEIEGTPHGTAGFFRGGPIAPDFKHEDVLPTLTAKAVDTLDQFAGSDDPFFLYFAMSAPHTPWLPVEKARGRSDAGTYGDFVWQVDDSIGAVLNALDRHGMRDNTLVIVTSDNGGLQSWLPEHIDHRCNGPWRGQKGDAWEGGHRVPFIARWPGRIESGAINDALICQTDLLATLAAITGDALPRRDAATGLSVGEDSESFAAALLDGERRARRRIVAQSVSGMFAVRESNWKLILGLGGGGLGYDPDEHRPAPGAPKGELYDLHTDPGETKNRWADNPDKVRELERVLRAIAGPDV